MYRNVDESQLPGSSAGKESACNTGDPGSIPESGRSPGEGIGYPLQYSWASPVAQLVKNPPAMWETWVPSLGWEDPLEKGKATHSVFWPGEFHGLAKSQVGLNSFHFSQTSLRDPSSLILVVVVGCSHLYLVPSSFHESLFNLPTSSLPRSNLSGDRVGGVWSDNCTSDTNEQAVIGWRINKKRPGTHNILEVFERGDEIY